MNNKLIDVFNNYDNSAPLNASFDNSELERLSKNKKKSETMAGKKEGIIAIVRKAEEAINSNLPASKRIKLDLTFTASTSNSATFGNKGIGILPKKDSNNGDTAMNINIKTLSRLPALELYSVVYKALYDYSHKSDSALENENKLENLSSEPNAKDKKGEKLSKTKLEAIKVLSDYLNKFLPKYFGNKFKKYDNISNSIATQIVNELPEQDIEKMLGVFFKFDNLGKEAINKVEEFLGNTENARLNFISGKATELLLDQNKDAIALSYSQQHQELMSVITQNKFKEAVTKQNGSLSAYKDFCVNYAHTILSKQNIADIQITFDSEGELGTFYDTDPPKININLQKIDSVTELALTLSHELKHAFDSCSNKSKGNYNRENNGGGLQDDISENISDSGLNKNSEEFEFLSYLNNFCYHINPNERNARVNELSALAFIDDMSKDTSIAQSINLNSQLTNSANTYITFQKKTLDYVEELSSAKIAEFRSKVASFGKIPVSAKQLFDERINYLEGMISSSKQLVEADKESIRVAEEILQRNKEREENKKNSMQSGNEVQRGE